MCFINLHSEVLYQNSKVQLFTCAIYNSFHQPPLGLAMPVGVYTVTTIPNHLFKKSHRIKAELLTLQACGFYFLVFLAQGTIIFHEVQRATKILTCSASKEA